LATGKTTHSKTNDGKVALLSFPNSPANNQLYPTSPLVGQNQYQWDSTDQVWKLLGSATGVSAGTYGDSSNVGQFTVDATGRVTFAQNVPISAVIPDLQQVTTQGAVTTDVIDVGGLIAAGLTYPNVDGSSGDYLTTDGAGLLSWVTPPTTPSLNAVVAVGNATTSPIDVGGLVAAGLFYPLSDGTVNQVMATDGGGNLGWLSTLKVVPVPTASADPGNLGEVAIGTGFFYFFDGTQWLQVAGVPF
jgi:hypothetical protein